MFGIVTLVLAVVGTSIAYFSATTDVNDNTIAGQTASAANITLNVLQVSPTDLTGTSGKIIPLESGEANTGDGALQFENQMDAALKNNCVYNGYVACQVYRITVTNSGSDPVTATPKIKLTYNSGFENLRWQKLTGTNSSDFAVTGTSVKNHNEYTELSPITNLTNRTTSGNVEYVVVWLEETGLVQNETGLTFNGTVAVDVLDINNNPLVDNLTVDFNKKGNAVNYITNLYLNNKSKVVTNNSIQYQYSESVGLMNDRLGGTTSNYDAGNIRYYGAEPNNYVYLDSEENVEVKDPNSGWWNMVKNTELEETYSSYDDCVVGEKNKYDTFYDQTYGSTGCGIRVSENFESEEECINYAIENGYANDNDSAIAHCNSRFYQASGFESYEKCEEFYAKEQSEAELGYPYDQVEEVCDGEQTTVMSRPLYRIIGVFKDVTLSNGTKHDLIKVMRNESIGSYQWNGDGSNDWTNATLMPILNSGNGLSVDSFNNKIENVVWNLGGLSSDEVYSNQAYIGERGTTVYAGRPTEWSGKIALIYPSDFGYSTNFSVCNLFLNRYEDVGFTEGDEEYNAEKVACNYNSWLKHGGTRLFLSPVSESDDSIFVTAWWGSLTTGDAYMPADEGIDGYPIDVYPTFYLKADLEILSGNGSSGEPYVLG